MQFTMVDGGVAAIALLSGYLAYVRGFTREVLAIGGWVAAAVIAALATPIVEPLMREAPLVGQFLASSCILSVISAFVIVMALGLLILAVFTPIFSSLILDSVLGPIDRVLGFVFGIARAALIVAVGFLIYEQVVGPPSTWEPYATAQSAPIIEEIARTIMAALPTEAPAWLGQQVDAMMAPCTGAGAPVPTELPAPAPTQDS